MLICSTTTKHGADGYTEVEFMTIEKRTKFQYLGHTSRALNICTPSFKRSSRISQGWSYDIADLTRITLPDCTTMARNSKSWREVIHNLWPLEMKMDGSRNEISVLNVVNKNLFLSAAGPLGTRCDLCRAALWVGSLIGGGCWNFKNLK